MTTQHPKYRFLTVSENGEVYDTISKQHLTPQTNTHGYVYVKLQCGYRFYVHELVADTYLKPNTEFKRHMVVAKHIDGNPSNNYYKNLKWEPLVRITFGEVVWNPIPVTVVDITEEKNNIKYFDSKADMNKWFREQGYKNVVFDYSLDGWRKLTRGKYILLRTDYDDLPDPDDIESKYIYLLQDGNFVSTTSKKNLMQPERYMMENFNLEETNIALLELPVRNKTNDPIAPIKDGYGICYAEDYARLPNIRERFKELSDYIAEDVPF